MDSWLMQACRMHVRGSCSCRHLTACSCSLDLSANKIAAGFQALATLHQVTSLCLTGCLGLPPELSQMSALEELNVNCSPALAYSDSWRHIARLPNLRAVFAMFCGVRRFQAPLPRGAILFGLGTMPYR